MRLELGESPGSESDEFAVRHRLTQHDIGRERIIREATHRADLFSRKSMQSIARAEVMSRDMNG